MIYIKESGNSTSCFDLLDKFHTFILNNATNWTINKYENVNENEGYERKGKHLCINRNNVFYNFNSSDYRSPYNQLINDRTEPYDQNLAWLSLNLSLSFDTNRNWNDQPDYFGSNRHGSSYPMISSVLYDTNEQETNYDFFMSEDQYTFIISVEYRPNHFSHIIFGDFNKGKWLDDQENIDTETGAFVTASIQNTGYTNYGVGSFESAVSYNYRNTESILIPNNSSISSSGAIGKIQVYNKKNGINTVSNSISTNSNIYDYSWVSPLYHNSSSGTSLPLIGFELIKELSVNNFNHNSNLFPVEFFIEKNSGNYCRLGEIDNVYLISLKLYENRDILTIGNEQYYILPLCRNQKPHSFDSADSRGMGMAIKIA